MDDQLLIPSAWIGSTILTAAMLFSFVRLLMGPSLPDRIVALDTLVILTVGTLILFSIITGKALLLDVALAITLVSFMATVAFAISLDRGVDK